MEAEERVMETVVEESQPPTKRPRQKGPNLVHRMASMPARGRAGVVEEKVEEVAAVVEEGPVEAQEVIDYRLNISLVCQENQTNPYFRALFSF